MIGNNVPRLHHELWLNTGATIPDGATAADAMKIAGINWTVGKTWIGKGVYQLVRQNTGDILSVVGNHYETTQQTDAFLAVDHLIGKSCNPAPSLPASIVAAGACNHDRLVWILVLLPCHVALASDQIDEYYLLSIGHGSRTGPVKCTHLGIRKMTQATVFADTVVAIGHRGLDARGNWFGGLEVAGICHTKLQATVDILRAYVPSEPQVTEILTEVFAKSDGTAGNGLTAFKMGLVRTRFLRGEANQLGGDNYSAYALLCAIAEYCDWERKVRVREGETREQARLESAWFTYGAHTKAYAREVIFRMCAGNTGNSV